MLLTASYCPTARSLFHRSASLSHSSVGSEGYYFFHLKKKKSQESTVEKKARRDKRKRRQRWGGGGAHAAVAQGNCESFEGTDRCHLHVSAVHVAGKRGRGGAEGETVWEGRMKAGVQTIDLLPYFNPKKKEGKKT